MKLETTVGLRITTVVVLGLVLIAALAFRPGSTLAAGVVPATSIKGKQFLNELIANAQKEGELSIAGMSPFGPIGREIEKAFLNRFGLKIRFNLDTAGDENQQWSKMQVTMKGGLPPEFDVYVGDDAKVVTAIHQGLLLPIENWEPLLAEVNPLVGSGRVKPEQVSWSLMKGYALAWQNDVNLIMYNTRIMPKNDVPQRLIDIANARYKEKYVVAPFLSMWQLASLVYPQQQLLGAIDEIGKNAAGVLTFAAGSQRVALGEFAFQPLSILNYHLIKAANPNAPVGIHWPTDVIGYSVRIHAVPVKARHPAAGALFALWMTTPEAQEIWQKETFAPNIMFGETRLDLEVRTALEELKKRGSKVVSWFDNRESESVLEWFGTGQGAEYRLKILKALTQRK